jgi:hypothetical protein
LTVGRRRLKANVCAAYLDDEGVVHGRGAHAIHLREGALRTDARPLGTAVSGKVDELRAGAARACAGATHLNPIHQFDGTKVVLQLVRLVNLHVSRALAVRLRPVLLPSAAGCRARVVLRQPLDVLTRRLIQQLGLRDTVAELAHTTLEHHCTLLRGHCTLLHWEITKDSSLKPQVQVQVINTN